MLKGNEWSRRLNLVAASACRDQRKAGWTFAVAVIFRGIHCGTALRLLAGSAHSAVFLQPADQAVHNTIDRLGIRGGVERPRPTSRP